MERTRLVTKVVSVHIFVYHKKTQSLIMDFSMDYEFPLGWNNNMMFLKMREICDRMEREYPTRWFGFKLFE